MASSKNPKKPRTESSILLVDRVAEEVLSYNPGSYLFTGTVCRLWHRLHGYVKETRYEEGIQSLSRVKEIDAESLRENDFARASEKGDLDVMKRLRDSGCPWDSCTFEAAARHGSLDNMKWLKDNGCPWYRTTFCGAAAHGSLENMKWLKDNGFPWSLFTFAWAARHGNLENLKWLKDNGCPWDCDTFERASINESRVVMKWLTENGMV
jgi:hypothetical protein